MPFHHAENRKLSAILNCQKCTEKISEVSHYLECDKCKRIFHLKCAGIAGINVARASSKDTWLCKECKDPDTETGKRRNNENSPENTPTQKRKNTQVTPSKASDSDKLDAILQNMSDTNKRLDELISIVSDVKENQLFLSNQIDELNLKYEKLWKENDQLKKEVNNVKSHQKEQAEQIVSLQADIDVFQQSNLANNVIIGGVPNNIDEKNALSSIMTVLKTDCSINDVKEIIKLPNTMQNNQNSQLLLVKFKLNSAKMEFVVKKKEKKSLFVNELGFNAPADRQIFVRDHVTSYKKKLFNECREIKEQFNMKYLWMNGSNILMRQQERSKVFAIASMNDLNKLITKLSNKPNESQSQSVSILNKNNTSTGMNESYIS